MKARTSFLLILLFIVSAVTAATPVYKNARQVAKAYGMKSKDVTFE